jgi:bifunctional DNA-binding transcriptional regulator/antitoxin component of YhaV-PrlF toxin-antitoxin module
MKTRHRTKGVIDIPVVLAERLNLREGTIIEGRVRKGKLVIIQKQEKPSGIMKYAGIWEDENVDKIFSEIRESWSTWQKDLSA